MTKTREQKLKRAAELRAEADLLEQQSEFEFALAEAEEVFRECWGGDTERAEGARQDATVDFLDWLIRDGHVHAAGAEVAGCTVCVSAARLLEMWRPE